MTDHTHEHDQRCGMSCPVWWEPGVLDNHLSRVVIDGPTDAWPETAGGTELLQEQNAEQAPLSVDGPTWRVEAVPDPFGDRITLSYFESDPIAIYAPDTIELIGMLARAIHETAVRHQDHRPKETCPLAGERAAIKQATADVFILRETLKII